MTSRAAWTMPAGLAKRMRCTSPQPVVVWDSEPTHGAMLRATGKVLVTCRGDAGRVSRWVSPAELGPWPACAGAFLLAGRGA